MPEEKICPINCSICSGKVVIDEEEFSKLIHRIETMIQAPENKAAQQFARIAVEILKGYKPSAIATHLTKTSWARLTHD
jgi:hypothetical protein